MNSSSQAQDRKLREIADYNNKQTMLVKALLEGKTNKLESDVMIHQLTKEEAAERLRASGRDFCIRQGSSHPDYIVVEYVQSDGVIQSIPYRYTEKNGVGKLTPDNAKNDSFSSFITKLLHARSTRMKLAINELFYEAAKASRPDNPVIQSKLMQEIGALLTNNIYSIEVKSKMDRMEDSGKSGEFIICMGNDPQSLNIIYCDKDGKLVVHEGNIAYGNIERKPAISVEIDKDSQELISQLLIARGDVMNKWSATRSAKDDGAQASSSASVIGKLRKNESAKVTAKTGGLFTHDTAKVKKYDGNYFRKMTKDDTPAGALAESIEVVTGQLYQLLMPYQPETRLVKEGNANFILSKEVPGYVSLEDIDPKVLKQLINSGELKGFASMLTASYFLNEVDSKLRNMGCAKVNGQLTAIKIDNDWSLAALRSDEFGYNNSPDMQSAKITEDGLNQFPLMKDYKTHHLIDWVDSGKLNHKYNNPDDNFTLLELSLRDKPHFRNEVNEMILKTLLIDVDLIRKIIDMNVSDRHIKTIIMDEILNRKTQMMDAALKNKNFLEYLKTPEAKACASTTIKDAIEFNKDKNLFHDPLTLQANMEKNLSTVTEKAEALQTIKAPTKNLFQRIWKK